MENQNDLLRLISQALQQNQAVNEEIYKLLSKTTLPPDTLKELRRIITINGATLKLISDKTPIE